MTIAIEEGDVQAGEGLDLGNLTYCLACADLGRTRAFYETLGFVRVGPDSPVGGEILARADHIPAPGKRLIATYLSLSGGMLSRDGIGFRGGNVAAIAKTLGAGGVDLQKGPRAAPDGEPSLLIEDPDGRPVSFVAWGGVP